MPRKTNDDYTTPLWLREPLGRFDLDPCPNPAHPLMHASACITLEPQQSGLTDPWFGRVWLNCPYSKPRPWMARMARHRNGIAVVNVCVSTRWWHESVWPAATAWKPLAQRVKFLVTKPDGTLEEDPQPRYESALVAYGIRNALALLRLKRTKDPRLQGPVFILWRNWLRRRPHAN